MQICCERCQALVFICLCPSPPPGFCSSSASVKQLLKASDLLRLRIDLYLYQSGFSCVLSSESTSTNLHQIQSPRSRALLTELVHTRVFGVRRSMYGLSGLVHVMAGNWHENARHLWKWTTQFVCCILRDIVVSCLIADRLCRCFLNKQHSAYLLKCMFSCIYFSLLLLHSAFYIVYI